MTRKVFETPWFAVEEVPAQPEWNMGDQPFYQMVGPDHVLTIPVLPDGRLVMVRQFRPARGGFTLEMPAGGVDDNEDPAQAARRELLEETGYLADEWVSLGRSGLANHREQASCHVFAAFGLRQVQPGSERGVETVPVSPQDLARLVRANELDMLVTLGAIFMAKTILGERIPEFW